jgi:hypothetical protein
MLIKVVVLRGRAFSRTVRDLGFQEVVEVFCPLQGLVGLPESLLSLIRNLL